MKRKYVKVIAAVIGMAIMNGHPLTLNAKSKKNRTATPTGITIHGYGETASFSVDSKNLRTDEPIQVSATHGFEVSPHEISPNGKLTARLSCGAATRVTTWM